MYSWELAVRGLSERRNPQMTAAPGRSAPQIDRLAEAWAWQLAARCRDEDPSVFFHPDGERGHARKRRQERAKTICAECPVTVQCRDHSLIFRERFGTWGGLSEDERDRLDDLIAGDTEHSLE
jgi:WhiB family redox-sensing transcriptional regulator